MGAWVRRARKAAHLTQEELATRAGISVYTVSNLERGIPHAPRPDTVRLLADALHATPTDENWLLQTARSISESPVRGLQSSSTATFMVRPVSLPLPLTPLLGREEEVKAIIAQLQSPQIRLLSLLGVAGVGKTRLALECAHRLALTPGVFTDGIIYVSLAAVASVGLVPTAISEALGLRETSNSPLEEALFAAIADRTFLLVLDNCEHLTGIGQYVASLLMASPSLKALATSRSALSIGGEHRIEVRSLMPPPDAERLSLEELAAIPAVTLLLERAQAAHPGFTLTAENSVPIVRICRRLDGLPLALELAAPQLALLSPNELFARLDNRLLGLRAGGVDLPARQRTLRGTLDWSYDLLDPPAQTCLRWLSVCAGGSTLELAEALCAQALEWSDAPKGSTKQPGTAPFEVIVRLANHCLVQRQSSEAADAERRLTMLATIEEYASERLHESAV
jgi:predicted ATPase/DNA-binding XRE family transcriptional regulator